jgi:hypothetical protein
VTISHAIGPSAPAREKTGGREAPPI